MITTTSAFNNLKVKMQYRDRHTQVNTGVFGQQLGALFHATAPTKSAQNNDDQAAARQ